MRSLLHPMTLASLILIGLTIGAAANDRYTPRPPVLIDEGYPERPRIRERSVDRPVVRRVRPATQESAGLVSNAAPSKQRKARRDFDPAFLPTVIPYDGNEAAGTIVIDTASRYLYLVEADGSARRYGVGVGKAGFDWVGTHSVTRKAEWPTWTPPPEMRKRRPGLPVRMEGGPNNPLGARALYLGSTLYRIHGSNEPWTIGKAVSSGCFRMRNEDVVDLYERVDVGARVIVR
ncbi:L,D-transpeptidase [Kaistia sp. 32K]|uniref:L,D-transpeptidase n=1 Tax=Kaistia sp. 32K TaxID=2795690 RepID=UPI0019153D8F|nr:L,D-transpeptidase [Kaistia sp. 32K]BCP52486.1 L,D-transpeptidase [Kaistia sp. 32K]